MREIYIFKRMEVLKIKTKSDSKGTKDKIIELFFIKRLKPVEIAKKLNVGMPYITKIIQKDERYIEEKESRKSENKEKNKIQKRIYAQNRREKEKQDKIEYERLSNENIEVGNGEVIVSNEDERESGSISTQKLFLRNFCKENNIRVYDDYTDDGFSGATFDRPDFNRMIKDIENKKINLIIVKDLSRFGRLSSKISYYLEEFFIEKGVRFIEVTDDIDTGHIETSEEMVQFKAFFNEWFLRDTSRKVRNGKKTRAKE